jgi:hypothetical protein
MGLCLVLRILDNRASAMPPVCRGCCLPSAEGKTGQSGDEGEQTLLDNAEAFRNIPYAFIFSFTKGTLGINVC